MLNLILSLVASLLLLTFNAYFLVQINYETNTNEISNPILNQSLLVLSNIMLIINICYFYSLKGAILTSSFLREACGFLVEAYTLLIVYYIVTTRYLKATPMKTFDMGFGTAILSKYDIRDLSALIYPINGMCLLINVLVVIDQALACWYMYVDLLGLNPIYIS